MNCKVEVCVLRAQLAERWGLPDYATEGSAGIDLRAMIDSSVNLEPGAVHLIPSGIAIHIDDPSVAAVILPRSGLGHRHGIILGNSVGLIDSDYQGELMISCWNRSLSQYLLNPGERLAQLVFVPVIRPEFVQVKHFSPSGRGSGGFGHTGRT